MECRGSAEPSEKHLSSRALVARAPARQIRAGKAVDDGVVFEGLLQRIEPRYPIVGAHPEIAPLIFEDATDHVARQAISLVVDRELAGSGVELVESVLGAGPDPSGAVDVRRNHPVVAQRMWIIAVGFVDRGLTGRRIQTIQTGMGSTQPKRPLAVFCDRKEPTFTQQLSHSRTLPHSRSRLAHEVYKRSSAPSTDRIA